MTRFWVKIAHLCSVIIFSSCLTFIFPLFCTGMQWVGMLGQLSLSGRQQRVFLRLRIEDLKPQIPQYHTRQMRRSFKLQCNNLTGMSPPVQHYLYNCLTDDSTASNANQQDIDYRMRLVVLGELPELCADLRTLNTGHPNEYDTFLGILQSLNREVTTKDERRHGIAHF